MLGKYLWHMHHSWRYFGAVFVKETSLPFEFKYLPVADARETPTVTVKRVASGAGLPGLPRLPPLISWEMLGPCLHVLGPPMWYLQDQGHNRTCLLRLMGGIYETTQEKGSGQHLLSITNYKSLLALF